MELNEVEQKLISEYTALCHAMQSGVMWDQQTGSQDGTPKHLRVGINSGKCEHAVLVEMLVNAGVINREAYFRALRDQMTKEVARYEALLAAKLGKPITLG